LDNRIPGYSNDCHDRFQQTIYPCRRPRGSLGSAIFLRSWRYVSNVSLKFGDQSRGASHRILIGYVEWHPRFSLCSGLVNVEMGRCLISLCSARGRNALVNGHAQMARKTGYTRP
jgi:hypothetical protein